MEDAMIENAIVVSGREIMEWACKWGQRSVPPLGSRRSWSRNLARWPGSGQSPFYIFRHLHKIQSTPCPQNLSDGLQRNLSI